MSDSPKSDGQQTGVGSNSANGAQMNDGTPSTHKTAIPRRKKYWDSRFIATNVILTLLLILTAYLEYYYYPSIMMGAPFYERQMTLQLSFFTYGYNGIRCVVTSPIFSPGPPWPCVSPNYPENIIGIPAFDFAQFLIAILIVANLYHFWSWNKSV